MPTRHASAPKAPPRRRRRWGRIAVWVAVWAAGFIALIATDSFGLNSAWPVLLWSVGCLVTALMAGDRRPNRRPPR